MSTAEVLKNAALSFARAHSGLNGKAGNPARTQGGAVLTFGKQKGQAVSEVDSFNLSWYRKVLQENVHDPAKARWRSDNEAILAAVVAELESRGDA